MSTTSAHSRSLGSCVWGAPDWDQVDCCDKSGPYYVGDADAMLYCNFDPFAPQPGNPFQPAAPSGQVPPGASLGGPGTAPSIHPSIIGLHMISPSFFPSQAPGGSVGGLPQGPLGGPLGGGSPSPAPGAQAVGVFAGELGVATVAVLGGGALLLWWLLK